MIHRTRQYLLYKTKSISKYGIHSPFVYGFVTRVLYDRQKYPEYGVIEDALCNVLKTQVAFGKTDHGTGVEISKFATRILRIDPNFSATSADIKIGRLLFRLVTFFKPLEILALGTSLGSSIIYMAMGNQNSMLLAITGCEMAAAKTIGCIDQLGLDNIEMHLGSFESIFPNIQTLISQIDLVFIDGKYGKEPTLASFYQLLPMVHNDSILIFNEIHRDKEKTGAWNEIKNHPQVRVTIDLNRVGLVFFRQALSKQDFIIRF